MLLGGRTILLIGHHEVVLGLGSLGEFLHGDWTPSQIIFNVMTVLVLDLLGEFFARGSLEFIPQTIKSVIKVLSTTNELRMPLVQRVEEIVDVALDL